LSGLNPMIALVLPRITKVYLRVFEGDLHLSLKNLKVLPEPTYDLVKGYFYCGKNKLTSLEYSPKEVEGSFYCNDNKLTSLKYAPKKVGVDFWCCWNNLTSLDYAPREVGGDFRCNDNKVNFTESDVRKVCNVKGVIVV
jgi:hypothetical protein